MKKRIFSGSLLAAILIMGMVSCKKDPPTCDFTYTADGLKVTFTSVVSNANTYAWDFGDGNTSTEANPVHHYGGAGDFEVRLTVTGDGGTAEKKIKVTVIPGLEDYKIMLTGGPGAPNGKTWVLNTASVIDGDGASAIEPNMLVLLPIPPDFYGWMGRERLDGLKDEFTFKYDGSYIIDPKNDTIIAVSLFAFVNGITAEDSNTPYGTCRATPYVQPPGATWEIKETNFTVDAITNPADQTVPPAHKEVTFSGKKWLHFSQGSYLGLLDFTTSSNIIIKSISPAQLRVAMIVCMYQGAGHPGGIVYASMPTYMYHMTFIPKP
ncbi:MAG TPA: PKD domain-containing protein [Bacteroidales bacterium]|jgi:PKD repeat protein|nr:PKD domain-containing protein [Bacteroidales bacterium]HOS72457.1 PKD domain-containing protein [Bacteroidales bacterium]HQH23666.1 PKD domain-containing protein [Bacteroidales bacterium]HQJ81188.1 PKD domain-containing protein [Bacteroidales bacterium]